MPIYFRSLSFANAFCFHALSFGYLHIVCLFQILFCIMYSAFSQLVFLILCSHIFFNEMAMCTQEKYHLKITIIIIIISNITSQIFKIVSYLNGRVP